jgi:hypothetical protein
MCMYASYGSRISHIQLHMCMYASYGSRISHIQSHMCMYASYGSSISHIHSHMCMYASYDSSICACTQAMALAYHIYTCICGHFIKMTRRLFEDCCDTIKEKVLFGLQKGNVLDKTSSQGKEDAQKTKKRCGRNYDEDKGEGQESDEDDEAESDEDDEAESDEDDEEEDESDKDWNEGENNEGSDKDDYDEITQHANNQTKKGRAGVKRKHTTTARALQNTIQRQTDEACILRGNNIARKLPRNMSKAVLAYPIESMNALKEIVKRMQFQGDIKGGRKSQESNLSFRYSLKKKGLLCKLGSVLACASSRGSHCSNFGASNCMSNVKMWQGQFHRACWSGSFLLLWLRCWQVCAAMQRTASEKFVQRYDDLHALCHQQLDEDATETFHVPFVHEKNKG